MLHIVTWKWRQAHYRVGYSAEHVNALARAVALRLAQPHRFLCITDDPAAVECETAPLWRDLSDATNASGAHLPSCYRRLKLFDPPTQAVLGIAPGERVASIDLDVLVVGGLDRVFDRAEPFVGWWVRGTMHPRVYNGSVWMLRAGEHAEIWSGFDPVRSPKAAIDAGYFGSDQGWLSYRLSRTAAGWTSADGVLSYQRDARHRLPPGARIVCFHGRKKPWEKATLQASPWIARRLAG